MKILLITDNRTIRESLVPDLKANHYIFDKVLLSPIAVDFAIRFKYEVILLDLSSGGSTALKLCSEMRQVGITTPITLITAESSSPMLIAALDAGADDFLVLPCSPALVAAKLRAVSRRRSHSLVSSLSWGDLHLDPELVRVTYKGREILLSSQEYKLLEMFLRHPQQLFDRSRIIHQLWTVDHSPSDAAVTNLVKDLRRKLKASGIQEGVIETIYGLGYRLKPAPASQQLFPERHLKFIEQRLGYPQKMQECVAG